MQGRCFDRTCTCLLCVCVDAGIDFLEVFVYHVGNYGVLSGSGGCAGYTDTQIHWWIHDRGKYEIYQSCQTESSLFRH